MSEDPATYQTKPDPNYPDDIPAHPPELEVEEAVITEIIRRRDAGRAKYGTTMERTDLTFGQWLVHAQQELLDGAIYLEKLKREPMTPLMELVETLKQEVARKGDENGKLRESLVNARRGRDHAEQKCAARLEQIDQQGITVGKLQESVRSLETEKRLDQQKIDQLRRDLADAGNRIGELQTSLRVERVATENRDDQIKKLKAENDECHAVTTRLRENQKELDTNNKRQADRIKELEARIDQQRARLADFDGYIKRIAELAKSERTMASKLEAENRVNGLLGSRLNAIRSIIHRNHPAEFMMEPQVKSQLDEVEVKAILALTELTKIQL